MYDERGACLEPGGHTGVEWRLSDLTSRMGSGFNVVRGCQLGRCVESLDGAEPNGRRSVLGDGPDAPKIRSRCDMWRAGSAFQAREGSRGVVASGLVGVFSSRGS
ncbi:hypothetical protein V6N11_037821 [Hibiscus sabdariffa]|uniref:Uncharacterized protein n=1 Tax=Hibiscus sabdariffa TaxID=183260 RepID=A0ABR1ZKS9_9ROSI